MKYDDAHVKQTAKRFLDSWIPRVWHFVTSDVRKALLDSFVLDELRLAYEYDEDGTPTGHNGGPQMTGPEHACALLHFRDRVEAQLKEGISLGGRSMKRHFQVGE